MYLVSLGFRHLCALHVGITLLIWSREIKRENMSIVAFDTKEFRRGREKTFFAPIGVSLRIDDEAEFKANYDAAFNELSPKFRFDRKRKVYSTYELIGKLGFPKTIAFIEGIFSRIQSLIKQMAVYYTILPPTKVPSVREYGAEGSGVKEVSTLKFLAELNPYYVYCCAWRYAQTESRLQEKLLLDNFEGKITDAWIELNRMCGEKLQVYPHGDRCNPFISAADMMVALLDFRLYRNKKRLDSEGITSVFSDASFDVVPMFTGQPHLSKLSPRTNRMIDVSANFKRPIIFILLEELELMRLKAVRKMFESSPLMGSILNKAFEMDCGVKFFDPTLDSTTIRDGDVFVCIGSKAKATAEYIKNMFNIEILSRENLQP